MERTLALLDRPTESTSAPGKTHIFITGPERSGKTHLAKHFIALGVMTGEKTVVATGNDRYDELAKRVRGRISAPEFFELGSLNSGLEVYKFWESNCATLTDLTQQVHEKACHTGEPIQYIVDGVHEFGRNDKGDKALVDTVTDRRNPSRLVYITEDLDSVLDDPNGRKLYQETGLRVFFDKIGQGEIARGHARWRFVLNTPRIMAIPFGPEFNGKPPVDISTYTEAPLDLAPLHPFLKVKPF